MASIQEPVDHNTAHDSDAIDHMSFSLSTIRPDEHDVVARLIHRGLVDWYEAHLRQGNRFGTDWEPFLIFPEVYELLDPGQSIVARDGLSGQILGVCFVHPRETHHSVGIVVTAPEAAGRGVAKTMMLQAIADAKKAGKPLRLVSSLLNLDSFSLYTRLGFVPGEVFQDLLFSPPAKGWMMEPPAGVARVRLARGDEAAALADFEHSLQGIRRAGDYRCFLGNTAGRWRVLVSENSFGDINGVMVVSLNAAMPMLGPGLTQDVPTAIALVWKALQQLPDQSYVLLAPAAQPELIQTFYSWGARNVELHVSQVYGEAPIQNGICFPTFLPESG
jgi:GNAT superfamily N-acetyltransferase